MVTFGPPAVRDSRGVGTCVNLAKVYHSGGAGKLLATGHVTSCVLPI